jgi:hypothetical protein
MLYGYVHQPSCHCVIVNSMGNVLILVHQILLPIVGRISATGYHIRWHVATLFRILSWLRVLPSQLFPFGLLKMPEMIFWYVVVDTQSWILFRLFVLF